MTDKLTTFQELFYSTFSEDKVKSDFISYLSENFSRINSAFIVSVYNEDTGIAENKIITLNDSIKIITYKCVFTFDIDLSYEVQIAIGKFLEDTTHMYFFQVEKCIAKLRYNCYLEVIDIEFTTNKIHEMK